MAEVVGRRGAQRVGLVLRWAGITPGTARLGGAAAGPAVKHGHLDYDLNPTKNIKRQQKQSDVQKTSSEGLHYCRK